MSVRSFFELHIIGLTICNTYKEVCSNGKPGKSAELDDVMMKF